MFTNHEPERKVFLDFVEQHPNLSMDQLVAEYGQPYVWCWDRLGLFFLNELASYCLSEGVLKPYNALLLSQLRAEEQGKLLKQAIKLPPADFRIVFGEFVRAKVRAVEVPTIPPGECLSDALKIVPILKRRIADLKCELQSAKERSSNLDAAYRRAVSPDPGRYYKD